MRARQRGAARVRRQRGHRGRDRERLLHGPRRQRRVPHGRAHHDRAVVREDHVTVRRSFGPAVPDRKPGRPGACESHRFPLGHGVRRTALGNTSRYAGAPAPVRSPRLCRAGGATLRRERGGLAGRAAIRAVLSEGRGRVVGGVAEGGVRGGAEAAASAEVVDDGGRHDGDDAALHLEADVPVREPVHDAAGRAQPVGAAARQGDGVYALDQVARVQEFGLAGAGGRATHVHPGHPGHHAAGRRQDDGGAGQVAVTGPLGMPDPEPGDVSQGVGRTGSHPRLRVRKRRAASAKTRVHRTISATSTYSSD